MTARFSTTMQSVCAGDVYTSTAEAAFHIKGTIRYIQWHACIWFRM